MKTLLLALLFSVAAVVAQAQPFFGIPMKDTDQIEQRIQESLQLETGFAQLRDFRVDWTQLQCMQVEPSEMDPDAQLGVCVVNVSAFQVESKAAIVRKASGYDVSIVYANVE
jgi:hypothetical protein